MLLTFSGGTMGTRRGLHLCVVVERGESLHLPEMGTRTHLVFVHAALGRKGGDEAS